MGYYLYMLAFPMEALVASQLPPENFARYMATGTRKMARGKEIFLQLKADFTSPIYNRKMAEDHCVPEPNGALKSSVYLSVYRVLEQIPLAAVERLHLVTQNGDSLALAPQHVVPNSDRPRRRDAFLYQELSPARPLVASGLDPIDFGQMMTDPKNPVSFPKLLFARLRLGSDPRALAQDLSLPYRNLPHLQDCVLEVLDKEKSTKTVDRAHASEFLYSTIMDGLYLAEWGGGLYFPFPKDAELKDRFFAWWHTAE